MPAVDIDVPLGHPSLEPVNSDGGIETRGVATIDNVMLTSDHAIGAEEVDGANLAAKGRAAIAIDEDGPERDTAPSDGRGQLAEPDIDVRLGTIIVMVGGDCDVMLTEGGSESVIDLPVSDELVAVLDDIENLDSLTVLANEGLVARGLEGPSLEREIETSLSDWEEGVCAVCGHYDHETILTC
jgi:hypothetical protein